MTSNHRILVGTRKGAFGTSTGQLYGSADDGESWRLLASHLPGISSVETAVVDA